VQRGQERLKEAAKLGFTQAIVPAANQPKQTIPGMEIHPVHRLDEAIRFFREN
jgi:DNA repair protein RadA/Sms